MGKPSIPCTIVSALILGAAAVAAQPLEISGSVLTPDGDPLATATVELRPLLPMHELAELQLAGEPGPAVVRRTRTDRDGEFRLDAPAGFWTLAVRHPDHLPAAHELSPLLVSRRLGDLHLPRRSELAARLADDEDRPIAGVALWVAGWSEGWRQAAEAGWRPLERTAHTDADGLAVLPCASDETVTVAALHRDRFLYHEELCEAGLVTLALDGALQDARLIQDDGAPASGAYGFFRQPWLAFGLSDEQGLVRGPGLGVPVVFADDLGFYGQPRWRSPAEGGGEGDVAARGLPALRLPPAVTFSGQAVDAFYKTPVDGVWLWVGRGDRYFQTVEHGAFEVRIPEPGPSHDSSAPAMRGMVSFGGPDYLASAHRAPSTGVGGLREGRQEQHRTVQLMPAMSLAGRVVAASGDDIAGARVEGGRRHMSFGYESSDLQDGQWLLDAVTKSAGDGAFELRRLAPLRSFEVRVSSPGFAAAYESVPALEPGGLAGELVVVLERGVNGFGLVVDEREIPIAGAEVALLPARAFAEQDDWGKENPRATTGGGGRFTLHDLPAGRYYLSARAAGFPELLVPGGVEVAIGKVDPQPIDLGTLVLVPGIKLAGRVLNDDGGPVADAELSVRNAGVEQIVVRPNESRWFASATSRQNGSFQVDGLPRDRRLILLVSAAGYLPRELAVTTGPGNQHLDVELSPAAWVTGRVLDPAGQPVAGALVAATAAPEPEDTSMLISFEIDPRLNTTVRTVVTDEEGRFEALGLQPGDYTFNAILDATKSRQLLRRVPVEGLKGVSLELERKASLAVKVLNSRGVPVALAAVTARAGGRYGGYHSGQTDGRGLAVLQALDGGAYRLTAEHAEYGSAETLLDVVAAGDQQIELRLDPSEEESGLEVSGRVIDPAGLPMRGVSVALVSLEPPPRIRPPRQTVSGAGGAFTFRAPPGEYRLGCRHQRFAANAGEPFTLADSGRSGMVVELSEGARVTGQINGLEPEDLARLKITADGSLETPGGFQFGAYRHGSLDFEGGLRIEGLAPGEWKVRAELLEPIRLASETIEVTSDGEVRVDLHFAPGHRLTGSVLGPGGPVAGATVAVACEVELRGETFTGVDGRFAFDHLPGGSCRVSATEPASGGASKQRIELVADTDIVLEIGQAAIDGGR